VTLAKQIEGIVARAEEIKGTAAANEANTRAVLIEPLMKALGWDTSDPTKVTREIKVFDGTWLDYALLIDGEPHLFLEAKALGKSLDDNAFISQTINYANNEGVTWCVLTNGLVYRIYKTNESVGMQDKLLLEIDLREALDGSVSDIAGRLEILRPESIGEGQLDSWGEQVFADQRVRAALGSLSRDPPAALLEALQARLGNPKIDPGLLQQSLERVLSGVSIPSFKSLAEKNDESSAQAPKETTARRAKTFPLEHHTDGRPAAIVDLFRQVDTYATALGPDVTRRSRKMYVGYFIEKRSFFTMELQKTRIWVYLALDPDSDLPWNPDSMRDVRNIGHYGLGNTEFNLANASQLKEVEHLIALAYAERR
jgi:predicted transport protein